MNAPFPIPNAKLGDVAELRAALAAKIRERNLAQSRRDQTAEAVKRAANFVGRLEANLAAFADTDSRIARSRAESFRRALAEGDATPMLSLSSELGKAAAQKLDAENQLDAARQAYKALALELAEEQASLDRLKADTRTAAKHVISCYADHKAVELAQLENEAGELRRKLLGLTQMRSPHIGNYQLAPQTIALLRDDPINSLSTRNSGNDVRHWDLWLERLLNDAEAMP